MATREKRIGPRGDSQRTGQAADPNGLQHASNTQLIPGEPGNCTANHGARDRAPNWPRNGAQFRRHVGGECQFWGNSLREFWALPVHSAQETSFLD